MGDVLAFIEERGGSVRSVAREVVTVAADVAEALGGEVHGLTVTGGEAPGDLGELGAVGADVVHAVTESSLEAGSPEVLARRIADIVGKGEYHTVVFGATAQGKDLSPRVAALLDVPLASDVTALDLADGALTLIRPVFAGKAFVRLSLDAEPAVFSIRPNVFQPVERPSAGDVRPLVLEASPSGSRSRVLRFEEASGGSVDVSEAAVIVSGGRGMKDPENWGILEELRDALGDTAALGASRAVVDAGWRPHNEQVGQTGKTVSPKLYIAVGISGAIQHLAGMRTAQTIVAVNKDTDAPIFGVANYGVVGDLFEIVPRLTAEVRALRSEE